MKLIEPSFDDLRRILADPDPGIRAELDAFNGAGVWTVDGESARRAADARCLPSHLILDEAGAPVLAMGLTMQRAGVVQTWFLGRDGWTAHNAAIVECYGGIVEGLFRGGVHRIQVVSLGGRPRVREWFQRFGFEHEGVQRGAGVQGEDLDFYGMTGGAHVRRQ